MGALADTLSGFLAAYGLLAIFVVMLLKEAGIPIPVPSDLVMITAGVQAAAGAYSLLDLILAIEIAIVVGGSTQFLLTRGAGRAAIYRVGRYVGLTPARLDRAAARLRDRGPLAIFLGLNLPGARAGMVVAAGLAGLSYRSIAPAMVAGNTVFHGWHVALGFLVGPSAALLLEGASLPILLVVLGLALLGLAGWLLLRRRQARRAEPTSGALEPLRSWTEAACPACLTISALERIQPRPVAVASSSS